MKKQGETPSPESLGTAGHAKRDVFTPMYRAPRLDIAVTNCVQLCGGGAMPA
jgi:hypothetical protein